MNNQQNYYINKEALKLKNQGAKTIRIRSYNFVNGYSVINNTVEITEKAFLKSGKLSKTYLDLIGESDSIIVESIN